MSSYYSITKFAETILSMDPDAKAIALFFEPADAREGKFDNFTISPIGMVIKNGNLKELCLAHLQLMEFFNGKQIIISVPKSFNKKIPEDKGVHYLEIGLNKINWNGGYYYYSEIFPSYNQEVNEFLLNSKLNLYRRTHSQVNIDSLTKASFN